jgi:outer membrane receptor for ferrienterochelin and colicins
MKVFCFVLMLIFTLNLTAQNGGRIYGYVKAKGQPLQFVSIGIKSSTLGVISNSEGYFSFPSIDFGKYELSFTMIGYVTQVKTVYVSENKKDIFVQVDLVEQQSDLNEIVVTGTMKEVSKTDSPVPIEIYNSSFFQKNPTPNIFESLQNINGVRPQLNCNVCNTGDIHINGLEGPYTMILIDGMPIVSGLSTVYGLSGIPNSLVERIEIVKGPASSLYGSEAVGGLINVITKKTSNADKLSIDVMSTSYLEHNVDVGFKQQIGKKISSLVGLNYYNYQNPIDNNGDGFTDVTLQQRVSLFNKLNLERIDNKEASIAFRYFYEDRWGGDMNWNSKWRGTDSIYGESIFTNRYEMIGKYQLPLKEKIMYNVSLNNHQQNSYYGITKYLANQTIFFNQLYWEKEIDMHSLLLGVSYRYTWFDDNTTVTQYRDSIKLINKPNKVHLPGIFVQDEIKLNCNHKLLLGFRYDYNQIHCNIYTPRLAYKWNFKPNHILRFNTGTGYRINNVFSEDHAALTGARDVVVQTNLKPEQSYNANINYLTKVYKEKFLFGIDVALFYTYFTNRIIADYETDANKIYFSNLNGHSVSKGISSNIEFELYQLPLKFLLGGTLMDNYKVENNIRSTQLLTENFSGTWSLSYQLKKLDVNIDYTGNVRSPMKLPLLGDLDTRDEFSPWWSIQNIQVSKEWKLLKIYGGIKNILNYTPPSNSIARPFDPFDKQVVYDNNGQVIATNNNPNALSFDPTYMFAPNQGIRFFIGLRYKI